MKTLLSIGILYFTISSFIYGQTSTENTIMWSPSKKLEVADYKLRSGSLQNNVIYSQFTIGTKPISAIELFKKNLNQKVENLFYRNASWIDTTATKKFDELLRFQQLCFDMSEIQARKYRKKLLQNKSKLLQSGLMNALLNKRMNAFSEMRIQCLTETKEGTDMEKVKEWEIRIQQSLDSLSEFSFSNTKKIKLKK